MSDERDDESADSQQESEELAAAQEASWEKAYEGILPDRT
jgi:hypothetical protein